MANASIFDRMLSQKMGSNIKPWLWHDVITIL